jgi:hypothetical protein
LKSYLKNKTLRMKAKKYHRSYLNLTSKVLLLMNKNLTQIIMEPKLRIQISRIKQKLI